MTARNLGKGMKPRGVENKEIEEIAPDEPEGQTPEYLKNLRDLDFPDPSPTNLAADSDEIFVAPKDPQALTTSVQAIESGLEALMAQSKEEDERESETSPAGLITPTAAEIEAIENGEPIPVPGLAPPDMKPDKKYWEDEVIDGREWQKLGPQPNGDYGVVVTVPEQMVSLVLGQAEMDGVSPGEWLTVRLGEYLESWTFGR